MHLPSTSEEENLDDVSDVTLSETEDEKEERAAAVAPAVAAIAASLPDTPTHNAPSATMVENDPIPSHPHTEPNPRLEAPQVGPPQTTPKEPTQSAPQPTEAPAKFVPPATLVLPSDSTQAGAMSLAPTDAPSIWADSEPKQNPKPSNSVMDSSDSSPERESSQESSHDGSSVDQYEDNDDNAMPLSEYTHSPQPSTARSVGSAVTVFEMNGNDLLEKITQQITDLEEDYFKGSDTDGDDFSGPVDGSYRQPLSPGDYSSPNYGAAITGDFVSARPTGVTKSMDKDYLEARMAILDSLKKGEPMPTRKTQPPSLAKAAKPTKLQANSEPAHHLKSTACSNGHTADKIKKKKKITPKTKAGKLTPPQPKPDESSEADALDPIKMELVAARKRKLEERARKEAIRNALELRQTEEHRISLTSKDVPGKVCTFLPCLRPCSSASHVIFR